MRFAGRRVLRPTLHPTAAGLQVVKREGGGRGRGEKSLPSRGLGSCGLLWLPEVKHPPRQWHCRSEGYDGWAVGGGGWGELGSHAELGGSRRTDAGGLWVSQARGRHVSHGCGSLSRHFKQGHLPGEPPPARSIEPLRARAQAKGRQAVREGAWLRREPREVPIEPGGTRQRSAS
jgi:hypothetical protein